MFSRFIEIGIHSKKETSGTILVSFLLKHRSISMKIPLKSFISNSDSLDWKDYGVDSIIDTVTKHKHLGSGSIILCHNGAKYTAQALDTMITTLKEAGYTFVPLSELIYREGYSINHEGRQIKE